MGNTPKQIRAHNGKSETAIVNDINQRLPDWLSEKVTHQKGTSPPYEIEILEYLYEDDCAFLTVNQLIDIAENHGRDVSGPTVGSRLADLEDMDAVNSRKIGNVMCYWINTPYSDEPVPLADLTIEGTPDNPLVKSFFISSVGDTAILGISTIILAGVLLWLTGLLITFNLWAPIATTTAGMALIALTIGIGILAYAWHQYRRTGTHP